MTPKQAKTFNQVCSLPRDNFSTRDFWLLLDGGSHVVLCEQRNGQPPKGNLRISKGQFDRLIHWYTTGRIRAR